MKRRTCGPSPIKVKDDSLRGLMENVIVGRLNPNGICLAFHRARKEKEVWDAEERHALLQQEKATWLQSCKRWKSSRMLRLSISDAE